MSGIVGYIGQGESLEIILKSMRRFEPRGASQNSIVFLNGRGFETYEARGRMDELEDLLPSPLPRVRAAIGRVAWTQHPNRCGESGSYESSADVVVLYSGVICTSQEAPFLKDAESFVRGGALLPDLIGEYLLRGLSNEESIKKSVSMMRGSFALCVICCHTPDRLYVMRRGLPLAIGFADNFKLVASDIGSLIEFTKDIVLIEDEQLCVLGGEGIKVFHASDEALIPAPAKTVHVNWTDDVAVRNGHEHHMKKEIFEQPQAVMDTVGEWVEHAGDFFTQIGVDTKTLLNMKRLHLVACGTSYHSALIGRYLIEGLARIPVSVDVSSEYRFMKPITEKGTLFVSITQSGETADTLNAQREAKLRGARTLTICNIEESTAVKEADFALLTRAGIEMGVTATKTFTAQVAALCLMALSLAIRRGRVNQDETTAIRSLLLKIPSQMENMFYRDDEIESLAGSMISAHGFLYTGRGINYPVALEAALKLKEVAYMHADACPAGEIRHGPLALIEDGVPLLAIVTSDELYQRTLSNIREVKSRGGKVIALSSEDSLLRSSVDHLITVPSTHPVLTPLLNVIPLQLLAYHIGAKRGCDVDRPRTLSKSLSEER